jgi:hypothetical protein
MKIPSSMNECKNLSKPKRDYLLISIAANFLFLWTKQIFWKILLVQKQTTYWTFQNELWVKIDILIYAKDMVNTSTFPVGKMTLEFSRILIGKAVYFAQ